MPALLRLAALVTAANRALFGAVAWLALAMVLLVFAVALLRYAFNWGSVGLQEAVLYLHAALFMLAIPAGLAADSHVRVDIFYAGAAPRTRALVDGAGSLLLVLPMGLFLLWSAWDYVGRSWQLAERSTDAGGVPYVYLLKTLIPVLAVQLVLQALAQAVVNLQRWRAGA